MAKVFDSLSEADKARVMFGINTQLKQAHDKSCGVHRFKTYEPKNCTCGWIYQKEKESNEQNRRA